MVNGNIDFSGWNVDAIRKYFSTLTVSDLKELASLKAGLNIAANKQAEELAEVIRPLELQLADAASKDDMNRISKLSVEIKKLRAKHDAFRFDAIKSHLEYCCIWIESNERMGLTEADYTSEELVKFPARTWDKVKQKQQQFNLYNYQKPGNQSGGERSSY